MRGYGIEFQGVHLGGRALAALGAVAALAVAAAPARADTMRGLGDPGTSPDPPGQTRFADSAAALTLTRRASKDAPGYSVVVSKDPFEITTVRDGQTVLATSGDSATAAAARFVADGTSYFATSVSSSQFRGGTLSMQLATTDPGVTLTYAITPSSDRYRCALGDQ